MKTTPEEFIPKNDNGKYSRNEVVTWAEKYHEVSTVYCDFKPTCLDFARWIADNKWCKQDKCDIWEKTDVVSKSTSELFDMFIGHKVIQLEKLKVIIPSIYRCKDCRGFIIEPKDLCDDCERKSIEKNRDIKLNNLLLNKKWWRYDRSKKRED